MTGLYTFEFVREEGPLPGDTLLLREISPRERQGKTVRIYGFSDGRAVEMTFPDQGGEEGANQIAWEREQLHLPPPSFSRSP